MTDPTGNDALDSIGSFNFRLLGTTPVPSSGLSIPNSYSNKNGAIDAALTAAITNSVASKGHPPDQSPSDPSTQYPEAFGFIYEFMNSQNTVSYNFTAPVTDVAFFVSPAAQQTALARVPAGAVPIAIVHDHPNRRGYRTRNGTYTGDPCNLEFSDYAYKNAQGQKIRTGDVVTMQKWGRYSVNQYLNTDFGSYILAVDMAGKFHRMDWSDWTSPVPDDPQYTPGAGCGN